MSVTNGAPWPSTDFPTVESVPGRIVIQTGINSGKTATPVLNVHPDDVWETFVIPAECPVDVVDNASYAIACDWCDDNGFECIRPKFLSRVGCAITGKWVD